MNAHGRVFGLLYVAICLRVVSGADLVPEFRRDYEFVESENAFYKAHRTPRTWAAALRACSEEGTHLVAPATRAETELLIRLQPAPIQFIGVHDYFNEGVFTTVAGSTNFYIKWKPGEPNNNFGKEHCVVLVNKGDCNDAECGSSFPFVCKKDLLKQKKRVISPFQVDGPEFRSDYTYYQAEAAFFKHHTIKLKWVDAFAKCMEEGAHLLTVESTRQAGSALEKIKTSTEAIWIALHDIFEKGNFVTLEGEPSAVTHIEWASGEPKTIFNNTCVVLSVTGLNHADDCLARHEFLCKKKVSDIKDTNLLCETHVKGYEYSDKMDECYKLHTVAKSWHDAHRVCKSEEAQLAIINSDEEANVLVTSLRQYPPNKLTGTFDKNVIHLGFNSLVVRGVHLTIEGKSLAEAGYSKWRADQPDNRDGMEHCGSMFRDGRLNDVNCRVQAMFFCEKKLYDTSQAPFNTGA